MREENQRIKSFYYCRRKHRSLAEKIRSAFPIKFSNGPVCRDRPKSLELASGTALATARAPIGLTVGSKSTVLFLTQSFALFVEI